MAFKKSFGYGNNIFFLAKLQLASSLSRRTCDPMEAVDAGGETHLTWWSPRFWSEVVQPSDALYRLPAAWHRQVVSTNGGLASAPAPALDPRPLVATLWRDHAGAPMPPLFARRWQRWLARLDPVWRVWVETDLDPTHVFLGAGWDWGFPFTWDDGVIVWPGAPAYWEGRDEASAFDVFTHEVCHLWQRTQEAELRAVYLARGAREGFRPLTPDLAARMPAAHLATRIRNPDGLDLWEVDVPGATNPAVWGYLLQPATRRPQQVNLCTGRPDATALHTGRQKWGTHQLDHPHEFTMPALVRTFGSGPT